MSSAAKSQLENQSHESNPQMSPCTQLNPPNPIAFNGNDNASPQLNKVTFDLYY
jgi:hypothetical protein